MGNAQFFKDIEFRGEDRATNFIFDKDSITASPLVTADYHQVSIPTVIFHSIQ